MSKQYVINLGSANHENDTLLVSSTLKGCYKLLLKDTNKLIGTTDITNAYHYVLRNAVWSLQDITIYKPELMTEQLENKIKELKAQLDKVNSTADNKKDKELLLSKLRDLLPLLSDKRLEYIFNHMTCDDVYFDFAYVEIEEEE